MRVCMLLMTCCLAAVGGMAETAHPTCPANATDIQTLAAIAPASPVCLGLPPSLVSERTSWFPGQARLASFEAMREENSQQASKGPHRARPAPRRHTLGLLRSVKFMLGALPLAACWMSFL